MENSVAVHQNIRTELLCDPSIPLLGVYQNNSKAFICKDICTPMFIAALFIVAKTGKQLVSFAGWLDKEGVIHMYSGILFSHKKRWKTTICENMGGPWEYHVKQNKSDRKC